jgi:two-component system phosphate regulon sensor histidine kinase PhoR
MTQNDPTPAQIVQALPLATLIIGPDERITVANKQARALLGQEIVGRHCITGLRQPNILDAIETVFRTKAKQESRYLGRNSGRDTTFRVNLAPIDTAKGTSVLISFEDLTDIEDAGKMRRDFVANVSHELKTPLTALMGFIETLRGPARNDPKAQDRFLSIMEQESARMSQLVSDLLSLSKVEENERIRPVQPVALDAIITSTILALAPVAEKSSVKVNSQFAPDLPTIPGDENQLRQVFRNLIENAIKYGSRGGRVDIIIEPPKENALLRGQGITVRVRDFGEGIAQHHIARLTERFYRVDSHRSREVGGTGLGLAIVKHIINRHRGRLRINSVLNEGSEFTVILPIE